MKVFVYGTLKQGHGNNVLLENSQFLGTGVLKGFTMYDLGAFPGIRPNGHGVVFGEIYDVDSFVLEDLDRLESYYPDSDYSMYIRAKVPVIQYGKIVMCFVYIFNREIDEDRIIESGKW